MSCAVVTIQKVNDSCEVNVSYDSTRTVNVQRADSTPSVNVSIVCTSSVADGYEMWWCRSWRVLWNDGIKALWIDN